MYLKFAFYQISLNIRRLDLSAKVLMNNVQVNLFIRLMLGAIFSNRVIREALYKGVIFYTLQLRSETCEPS
jgi:hypothetical protein